MLFCIANQRFIFNFFVSRPTAVNLSDAATKLQSLVSRTAETAKDAKSIFQVISCIDNVCSLVVMYLNKLIVDCAYVLNQTYRVNMLCKFCFLCYKTKLISIEPTVKHLLELIIFSTAHAWLFFKLAHCVITVIDC
jgi:hypothetical protein